MKLASMGRNLFCLATLLLIINSVESEKIWATTDDNSEELGNVEELNDQLHHPRAIPFKINWRKDLGETEMVEDSDQMETEKRRERPVIRFG